MGTIKGLKVLKYWKCGYSWPEYYRYQIVTAAIVVCPGCGFTGVLSQFLPLPKPTVRRIW